MNITDMEKIISRVKPVSQNWVDTAFARLDSLTKPKKSLGFIEELAARYVAIREQEKPEIRRKRVFVFVGDHKVVEEGVSAYPSEVTGQMVKNFICGGAAINVLAHSAKVEVEVIDIGMANDPGEAPGLIKRNVKRSADNIAKGPAMTVQEAINAIGVGIERAETAADDEVTITATGEMGIGNTTPAAALFASYLDLPVSEVAGPGTGLDAEGIAN